MTEKMIKAITKVLVIALLFTIVLILGVLYEHFTNEQFFQLRNQLQVIEKGVVLDGKDFFDGLNINEYRITWIESDGEVIYDSKASSDTMENHMEREEFKEALESGYGQSSRNSVTLSEKTLYSAKRLPDGSVLRVSTTQLSVISLVMSMLRPIFIIALVALILSVVFARRVSKKAIEPINNINLEDPLSNDVYEELSPLLLRIDKQNQKIKAQMDDLTQKNKEITYVIENVSDGIITLDKNGKVIMSNKKAEEIFSCSEGNYYLDFCRNLDYKFAVEEAFKGNSSTCVINIDNIVYKIYASTTKSENEDISVFLFISDVTDEESAQKMRREFTANVSHELKTPLSTILGSAELIENGIVKPAEIPYFAKKIHEEAARLLNLIQDIIKLSRLDEGNLTSEFVDIELFDICKSVRESLLEKSETREISIDIICDNSKIKGIKPVINEMIYNLCDNAITYNKEKGKVVIEVKTLDDKVSLKVSDTGIGIEKSDIPHIFERFYRVDKSRSKETGGTGLGLSIVKHGAELHKAKISVESEIDKGTTIEIQFPKIM